MPYKGAAEAITGVMSEQVQMFFGDIGGVLPLIREGRVRALAISSEARSTDLPTLPTMIESGVPGYVVLTYTGVVAPAATPPEIVGKLNAALNASLQTPGGSGRLAPDRRREPAVLAAGVRRLPCRRAREMARGGAAVRHQD